jgi:hypothetical protein
MPMTNPKHVMTSMTNFLNKRIAGFYRNPYDQAPSTATKREFELGTTGTFPLTDCCLGELWRQQSEVRRTMMSAGSRGLGIGKPMVLVAGAIVLGTLSILLTPASAQPYLGWDFGNGVGVGIGTPPSAYTACPDYGWLYPYHCRYHYYRHHYYRHYPRQ